jgi:hypothetical protein
MRCYGGGRITTAATATLPAGSLYAIANRPLSVLEVGVFNTTSAATVAALGRFTTAGTPGSGFTELCEDADYTPVGTLFDSHTSTAPTLAGTFVRGILGAAVGSGLIWTFGAKGLIVPQGTANGVGLYVPSGTGQVWDFYYVWEE